MECLCPECRMKRDSLNYKENIEFLLKLKNIDAEEIVNFVKETYNLILNLKRIKQIKTSALINKSKYKFLFDLQTHIRNVKLKELNYDYENPNKPLYEQFRHYPNDLIEKFNSYFNKI